MTLTEQVLILLDEAKRRSIQSQKLFDNLVQLIDLLPAQHETRVHCEAILPMAELIRDNMMVEHQSAINAITFQTGGDAQNQAVFNAQGQRAATFKKTPKKPTSQDLEGIDNDTPDERADEADPTGWPEGFFERTYGADEQLERPDDLEWSKRDED